MMGEKTAKQIGWRQEGAGWLVLFVAWFGFFWRQLLAGQGYFLGDIGLVFYPVEYVFGVFQRARQLPLWSSEFGFGHPLLSWGQLGFFTPLHVVLRELGLHALDLIQVSIMELLRKDFFRALGAL